MKHLFLIPLVLMASCYKDAVRTDSTTNEAIKVHLLFENDGVKVYRFSDGGQMIYYADVRGKTEWHTTKRNGKTTTTRKHQVNTVE